MGGWSGLVSSVDPRQLTMLRPADDPSGLPWYSVLLGYPVIGLWYWCADQTIVQRVLGAKDENHARTGPLFAGFIKVLPVFIFVLPGLLCFALIKQGKLPADQLKDSADTYVFMISHLLPVGLKGLLAAALLAALMGSVSGALNSIATLFSYDIYKRFKPQASERSLVFVGRVATFVGMTAAIIWSPFLSHFPSLFQGLNIMICHIAPPITAVFLWGVFSKRASATGALATLLIGAILGLIAFFLNWFKQYTGWNVPFMMTAFYLFVVCTVILFTVSHFRPQVYTAESQALYWKHPLEPLQAKGWPGLANYKVLAAILFATIVCLYIIFK